MASKLTALIPSSFPTLNPQLLMLLSFQYILSLLLPPSYALVPVITILLGTHLSARFTRKPAPGALKPEDYVKDVRMGRWTAQPSLVETEGDEGEKEPKKLAQGGIVCFVIAASSNQYVSFSSLSLGTFTGGERVSEWLLEDGLGYERWD